MEITFRISRTRSLKRRKRVRIINIGSIKKNKDKWIMNTFFIIYKKFIQ